MNDVLANAGAAVAGIVLAFLAAFAIIAQANTTPQAVDQPLVTYGER